MAKKVVEAEQRGPDLVSGEDPGLFVHAQEGWIRREDRFLLDQLVLLDEGSSERGVIGARARRVPPGGGWTRSAVQQATSSREASLC